MWWRSVIWTGIIFGSFFWLIPNVLWLVGRIVGRFFSYRLPYSPFGLTAIGIVLIFWVLLVSGYFFGRFRTVVNEIEFTSSNVPAGFDGFRFVHISDLHVDSFEKPEKLKKVIRKINEQNADVVLFTGDIVTGRFDGVRPHVDALSSIKAGEGVVSVLGNHDFFIYDPEYRNDDERCAAADRLAAFERNTLGWTVLRNQSLAIQRGGDEIAIAGVDNINGNQGFSTIQKGDLSKAVDGLEDVFTILLSHDPSHWAAEVLPKHAANITLSGHTHAAQVRLFGFSLARLMFKECDGAYYSKDGRMLYVNAGIGCTAPFRIGCPSEITVITLRHE